MRRRVADTTNFAVWGKVAYSPSLVHLWGERAQGHSDAFPSPFRAVGSISGGGPPRAPKTWPPSGAPAELHHPDRHVGSAEEPPGVDAGDADIPPTRAEQVPAVWRGAEPGSERPARGSELAGAPGEVLADRATAIPGPSEDAAERFAARSMGEL